MSSKLHRTPFCGARATLVPVAMRAEWDSDSLRNQVQQRSFGYLLLSDTYDSIDEEHDGRKRTSARLAMNTELSQKLKNTELPTNEDGKRYHAEVDLQMLLMGCKDAKTRRREEKERQRKMEAARMQRELLALFEECKSIGVVKEVEPTVSSPTLHRLSRPEPLPSLFDRTLSPLGRLFRTRESANGHIRRNDFEVCHDEETLDDDVRTTGKSANARAHKKIVWHSKLLLTSLHLPACCSYSYVVRSDMQALPCAAEARSAAVTPLRKQMSFNIHLRPPTPTTPNSTQQVLLPSIALPAGWKQHWSKTFQNPYYFNEKTNETT